MNSLKLQFRTPVMYHIAMTGESTNDNSYHYTGRKTLSIADESKNKLVSIYKEGVKNEERKVIFNFLFHTLFHI